MGRNKTKHGKRALNPTDAFRKEQRKKELKKNKAERSRVREASLTGRDPRSLLEQIYKLEDLEIEGKADKRHKTRKRELMDLYDKAVAKRKEAGIKEDKQYEMLKGVKVIADGGLELHHNEAMNLDNPLPERAALALEQYRTKHHEIHEDADDDDLDDSDSDTPRPPALPHSQMPPVPLGMFPPGFPPIPLPHGAPPLPPNNPENDDTAESIPLPPKPLLEPPPGMLAPPPGMPVFGVPLGMGMNNNLSRGVPPLPMGLPPPPPGPPPSMLRPMMSSNPDVPFQNISLPSLAPAPTIPRMQFTMNRGVVNMMGVVAPTRTQQQKVVTHQPVKSAPLQDVPEDVKAFVPTNVRVRREQRPTQTVKVVKGETRLTSGIKSKVPGKPHHHQQQQQPKAAQAAEGSAEALDAFMQEMQELGAM